MLIEVRDLTHTYMQGTPLAQVALRGVSCKVEEGQLVAIIGTTKAGKSTLIEYFNGLQRPQPGHVFFEGQDIVGKAFDLKRLRFAVGIVFQQPESQLFEETVGKDVSFAPRQKGLEPLESRRLVAEALSNVGLDYETFRNRYIFALSGGQKRRVAIAGVLAMQPRVMILDEPTAGLDPRGRAELVNLILDLRRRLKLTIVVVSSGMEDVLVHGADNVIVMHEGRVMYQDTPRQLLIQPERLHDLGLALPEAAEVALSLRGVYPDLRTDVLDEEELTESLLSLIRHKRPDLLDTPEVAR